MKYFNVAHPDATMVNQTHDEELIKCCSGNLELVLEKLVDYVKPCSAGFSFLIVIASPSYSIANKMAECVEYSFRQRSLECGLGFPTFDEDILSPSFPPGQSFAERVTSTLETKPEPFIVFQHWRCVRPSTADDVFRQLSTYKELRVIEIYISTTFDDTRKLDGISGNELFYELSAIKIHDTLKVPSSQDFVDCFVDATAESVNELYEAITKITTPPTD